MKSVTSSVQMNKLIKVLKTERSSESILQLGGYQYSQPYSHIFNVGYQRISACRGDHQDAAGFRQPFAPDAEIFFQCLTAEEIKKIAYNALKGQVLT